MVLVRAVLLLTIEETGIVPYIIMANLTRSVGRSSLTTVPCHKSVPIVQRQDLVKVYLLPLPIFILDLNLLYVYFSSFAN